MIKHPSNKAFQDECRIYRTIGATSFSEGEEVVLYEGKCDVQIPMTIRTFKSNDVLLTDHAVYIKKQLEGIVSGDIVDITLQTGVKMVSSVSECYSRSMGTMIILRETKN